jgi:phosphohistidine swiveling domain-containing protein
MAYWQALDSQVNPLADGSIADHIRIDSETRSASWVPGDGLLNLPKELFVQSIQAYDDTKPSGWNGTNFEPSTFLARPDIQALSIPTQMAMVDLNSAYAEILKYQDTALAAMNTQLTSVEDAINSASAVQGISLSSATIVTLANGESKILHLPTIEFDHTNNFVSPSLIQIQANGEYMVAGLMNTEVSLTPNIRRLEMLVNGKTVLFAESDNTTQASAVGFSNTIPLVMGDEVTYRAINNGTSSFDIIDTLISCLLTVPSQETAPVMLAATPGPTIKGYPVGVDSIAAGVAVAINAEGKILPIHPETDTSSVPWYDGVTLSSGALNETVAISLYYGNTYTIPGATFTEGSNIFVGPAGVLTENFTAVQSSCRWLIGVGKAMSDTDFIYEPQLPMDSQSSGGGGSYLTPAFLSFFIEAQSSSLEVGATSNANPHFVWTTSNSANIAPNSIEISDATASVILVTGASTTSPYSSTYAGVTKTTAGSENFTITATNSHSAPFTSNFTISWYDRVYYGESAVAPLNSSAVTGLRASGLQPSYSGVYPFLAGANEYKYLCFPTAFGTPNSFKDQSTNLNVPFDNPYVISVTNAYGVTITYNVFRSYYTIGGALSVVVG